jgi:uncharacterized protein YecE (DUF72 family)
MVMQNKPQQWHIGCSGFSYKEWKTVFYPDKLPQSKWFSYYSSVFDSLELNVTFYRFPTIKMLQRWYSNSPATFHFAVKVPRLITHMKQLNQTEGLLSDFYTSCKNGLKDKLGAILFQFPPKFIYTAERLEKIIHAVDPACSNAVEFRHSSWW